MLAIKLSRMGKKKQPTYRLVVIEKSKDPHDRSVEIIGHYNPRTEPKILEVDVERAKYWISQGAKSTETTHNLLVDAGVIEGPKVKATRAKKKEETEKQETKAEDKPKSEVDQPVAEAQETPTEPAPTDQPTGEAGATDEAKEEAPKESAEGETQEAEPAPDSAPDSTEATSGEEATADKKE